MPEGPECKTIADSINSYVKDKIFTNYIIHGTTGRYINKELKGINECLNMKVEVASCIGKMIYISLYSLDNKNSRYIMINLGLKGSVIKRFDEMPDYARITFEFEDKVICLVDQINFNNVIIGDSEYFDKRSKRLYRDIFTDKFNTEYLFKELSRRRLSLTKLLMDQSICPGVGNYIKSESLYRAGISPYRNIKDISLEEADKLVKAIKSVATESYEQGGVTLKDFINFDGEKTQGKNILQVYGMKTDKNGFKILKNRTDDGRITYYVDEIQK